MQAFHSKIKIIGINPYILIPGSVLREVFKQAGKDKGAIQVKGMLDDKKYIQTLVKYSGKWRLYLNLAMRQSIGKDVGDIVQATIEYDPEERIIPIHPKLSVALKNNPEAKRVFKEVSPSLRKEIIRYISFLKSEEAIERNVNRAINFLLGKERFVGRDQP